MQGWLVESRTFEVTLFGTRASVSIHGPEVKVLEKRRKVLRRVRHLDIGSMPYATWETLREVFREAGAEIDEQPRSW